MKTPLLIKGMSFTQSHEQVMIRIQSIRRKNDQYQRLNASQIDSGMAQQIVQQKSMLDNQIQETKKMIEQIENSYKQLPQKNKMKQTKKQFQKQFSRYKQISQTLMQKSVIKAQMRNSYRNSLPNKNNQNQRGREQQKTRQVGPNRQSYQPIAKQQELDIDYTMDHNVIMQRKKQLGKVQEHMQRVYQIHLDQANLVNQQGNMVDIIGQEMLKAQDNVQAANQELVQASIQQKKGRKKWYILILIIMLIVIVVGGGAFIFLRDKT